MRVLFISMPLLLAFSPLANNAGRNYNLLHARPQGWEDGWGYFSDWQNARGWPWVKWYYHTVVRTRLTSQTDVRAHAQASTHHKLVVPVVAAGKFLS